MIELTRLRAFCAVAEHRSYTKAAETLWLSQPRVHVLVRDLERSLGVKLIEQIGKTSHLTEAGRVLHEYGSGILRNLGDAEVAVAEVKRHERGSLYVGLTDSAPRHRVFAALANLRDQYPNISIQVFSDQRATLEQELVNREIDIAVLVRGPELPGIEYQPCFSEELVVVRPPGRAGTFKLTERALARLNFVEYVSACELHDLTDPWFAASRSDAGPFRCQSPRDAIAAVRANLGFGLIPASMAVLIGGTTESAVLESEINTPSVEYVVATPGDRELPPSALAFIAAMMDPDGGRNANER